MTDAERELAEELFTKWGLDNGGPISVDLNYALESFLTEVCDADTQFGFISTSHSPRLVSIKRPSGEVVEIDDDWDQVPEDIKPKIAFFIKNQVPDELKIIILEHDSPFVQSDAKCLLERLQAIKQ